MRWATLALAAALLVPFAPAQVDAPASPATTAGGLDTAETLDSMADWLLDRADGVHRNGFMRKLPWLSGPALAQGCTESQPCLDVDVQQSTAACSSLEFLALYYSARAAEQGRSIDANEVSVISEFADAVLSYRVDPTPSSTDLFDGAVASAPDASQPIYTSFGNAMCGQALLSAHQASNNTHYLVAAKEIGYFLLRMQDPREYYAPYGVHPFVDDAGTPIDPPGGFFDQVSSLNNTYSTMSAWNMTAVDFLGALDAKLPNRGFGESAAAGRDFLEGALDIGADWYTVQFDSPATFRNRIFASASYSANCQDNEWHRKGSCVLSDGLPVGGTLGTDMVEYGLSGMFRYDERRLGHAAALEASRAHYLRYAALPGVHTATATDPLDCVDDSRSGGVDPYYPPDNLGTTPSGDVWDYDPHLSFGGFFRSSGTALVTAEAKYYDIVGFGILAELRAGLVPDQFEHGAGRFLAAGDLTALLARDLTPMSLPSRDTNDVDDDGDDSEQVCIRTEGTLPIAHNGIGLLRTLGYVSPLMVSETPLPAAAVDDEYAAALAATGGAEPYRWDVVEGALPPGLALGDATLHGTPLVPGLWEVTLRATDANQRVAQQRFVVDVGGCDRTISGVNNGALHLESGVTCLVDAQQRGTIQADGSALVVLVGSTTAGVVQLAGDARATNCNSATTGTLSPRILQLAMPCRPAG